MPIKLHYAILTAYRDSTQTRLRRYLSFSGSKLEGLGQRINDFEESLGPTWDVYGEVTSQEYFEMRLAVMQRDEKQWNARLG